MTESDAPLEAIATGSRFLSSTVHEMRTPIQTIIGSLELLKMTSLDKEQMEYAHQMQVGAETLLALANDILDFSKLRSQNFQLENIQFNLVEVVERVMDSVSAEAFGKGLELVSDIYPSVPKFVMGDPTRLQQILLNIVKNAVKFTEKGYIHAIVEKNGDGALLFKVEDTGIGISKEARNKLFTDFYQADTSTTRKYGGTGLGLSICKALVAAMGGRIGVEPNISGGSVFWFTIPCVEAQNAKSALDKFKRLRFPEDAKILLVDDNYLARKSLESKLKDFGLPYVALAQSGKDALDMMRVAARQSNPFTLVLIDMVMPRMDGWRLASEINSDKTINDAKLFLIVPEGQLRQDAKMRMLNWFNGYIHKPVKTENLFKLLSDAFSDPIELKSEEPVIDEAAIKVSGEQIAKGVLVLVAEDHPVNRKLIVAFLKKMGAKIFEADDGLKAVQLAKENPKIDIVFMDLQMPEMNGLDATKALRKNGYSGVIVACTANHTDEDYNTYSAAGMNDLLGKPYKSDELKKVILKWKSSFAANLKPARAPKKRKTVEKNPVWDSADFEDTISGDLELGMQLIDDFAAQSEKLIKEIPAYIKGRDYETLRRIGHTIKGSAATISAFSLSSQGGEFNKAAHEKSVKKLREIHKALRDGLKEFNAAADAWKKERGNENELSYTHDFL
ncbi:MAG: response regulator [Treponema sp.]|nr:response regulator [Treponema sp.]